jgi:hypothetical protein
MFWEVPYLQHWLNGDCSDSRWISHHFKDWKQTNEDFGLPASWVVENYRMRRWQEGHAKGTEAAADSMEAGEAPGEDDIDWADDAPPATATAGKEPIEVLTSTATSLLVMAQGILGNRKKGKLPPQLARSALLNFLDGWFHDQTTRLSAQWPIEGKGSPAGNLEVVNGYVSEAALRSAGVPHRVIKGGRGEAPWRSPDAPPDSLHISEVIVGYAKNQVFGKKEHGLRRQLGMLVRSIQVFVDTFAKLDVKRRHNTEFRFLPELFVNRKKRRTANEVNSCL